MHDRPASRKTRHERARIESARNQPWQTAFLAEIALDKRNAAIRSARDLGLSLGTLARLIGNPPIAEPGAPAARILGLRSARR